jgi:hypothetical protein
MTQVVNKWSNVAVAMQSAIGTAKTITAIALGATATVTATHDFSAGDYVLFNVVGTKELNGVVKRVLSVSTTVSFVIEDQVAGASLDTTNYSAFTSGTCQKLTFGTSLATVVGVTGSGGDFNFIDTTTIHSNVKTQIPGIANAMAFSFDNIWDVADTALSALKNASDVQAQRGFKFTFASGQIMVFNGYVGASLIPGGNAQDKVTTKVDITAFGRASYYTA